MDRAEVRSSLRLAGQVKRYHTWPVLQRQTVAEHAWHTVRIYLTIWSYPPRVVLESLMYHDCGEIVLGDLPFPVKREYPGLKWLCDQVESEALSAMGVDLPKLDEELARRLKLCDLIEMHEFGRMEEALGNKFAEPIVWDTYEAILQLAEKLPLGERLRVRSYLDAVTGSV